MPLTYDDYLMHYGVKGMKWGVRKESSVDKQAVKRDAKEYAKSGFRTTGRGSDKTMVLPKSTQEKYDKDEAYKEAFDDRVETLKKRKKAVKKAGAALVAYGLIDQLIFGGAFRKTLVGVGKIAGTAAYNAGKNIVESQMTTDKAHVYITETGKNIRNARPNFGRTTTQVFPKEVTRGLRSLTR